MNAKELMTVIAFIIMGLATASAQITQERLQAGSDEQLLREWTRVLSHDEFGGRKPMTPYEDKTVDYLAKQLEAIGLEPAFNGSWLQPFEMIAVTAKPVGNRLTVSGKKKSVLSYPDTHNGDELAVRGWLHEDGCRKLFLAAGMDTDNPLADAKKPGFKSFSLNVKGDLKMNVTYDIKKARNVGGTLRGSGHNGEAVVFCAHWDHLGIGKADKTSDTIYNGAADNALGMAGALLVAKKFKEMPRPRRNLVFICPSTEESGLFGSAYYCYYPAVPMAKTVACLNFESIGPAEFTRDVVILGGGESDLDQYYV